MLRIKVGEGKHRLAEAVSWLKACDSSDLLRYAFGRWRFAFTRSRGAREQKKVVVLLSRLILLKWWQQIGSFCPTTQVGCMLWSKASDAALREVLVSWRDGVSWLRFMREFDTLKQDKAWYEARDVAVAGPRLLLPLARFEGRHALHVTFSAWRGLLVDLRNVEVVERLIKETQRLKAASRLSGHWLAQKMTTLKDILAAHITFVSWRQQLIDLRMGRSLDYVRSMASGMRKEVARRTQQSHKSLLSKLLDTWRWQTEANLQHQSLCRTPTFSESAIAAPLHQAVLANTGLECNSPDHRFASCQRREQALGVSPRASTILETENHPPQNIPEMISTPRTSGAIAGMASAGFNVKCPQQGWPGALAGMTPGYPLQPVAQPQSFFLQPDCSVLAWSPR